MVVMLAASCTGHALLPRNIFSASGTHFCWRMHKPQGLVQLEGLGKVKKCNDIGSQTHDLPTFSIMPQPSMLLQFLLYRYRDVMAAFCFRCCFSRMSDCLLYCGLVWKYNERTITPLPPGKPSGLLV
jgi:hypothetical protein